MLLRDNITEDLFRLLEGGGARMAGQATAPGAAAVRDAEKAGSRGDWEAVRTADPGSADPGLRASGLAGLVR